MDFLSLHAKSMAKNKKEDITHYRAQIYVLEKVSMERCAKTWKHTMEGIQQRDTFNPRNLEVTLEREHRYTKCIQIRVNRWLGMNFHDLMIWIPTKEYMKEYKLIKGKPSWYFCGREFYAFLCEKREDKNLIFWNGSYFMRIRCM